MSTKVLNDRSLEEYYAALFTMFGSRGWEKLMEDIGRMIQLHDTLANVESNEQLWFRKGQLDQMQWLAGLRDRCEHAYNDLLATQEDEPVEGITGGRAKIVGPDARPEHE